VLGLLAVLSAFALSAGIFSSLAAAGAPQSKAPVVHVTGVVSGEGALGLRHWSGVLLNGATVAVPTYSVSTTTAADGTYALDVPASGNYSGVPITASATYYSPSTKLMGGGNPQVVNFSLTVLRTTVKVTVRHAGKPLANARVFLFGWSRYTNVHGNVTFKLGLKPVTQYQLTIKKAGLGSKTFYITSAPGSIIHITKSL
jgi:hypothetical protein